METTNTPEAVSACCGARAIPDWAIVDDDSLEHLKLVYTCLKCEKDCEIDPVCEFCGGEGEVTTMEYVYPGEPHMAPIGTRTCICKLKINEYEHDQ